MRNLGYFLLIGGFIFGSVYGTIIVHFAEHVHVTRAMTESDGRIAAHIGDSYSREEVGEEVRRSILGMHKDSPLRCLLIQGFLMLCGGILLAYSKRNSDSVGFPFVKDQGDGDDER